MGKGEQNMRVALVDDVSIIRESLENKLKTLFFEYISTVEIESFQTGDAFLKRQEENAFQVVFLDIFMPGLDGLKLAQKLREWQQNIIIIFCTSDASKVFDSIKFKPFRYIRKDDLDFELQEVVPALLNEISQQNNRLIIKTSKGVVSVDSRDILYFESKGHYLQVHLKDEIISYKGKINDREQELSHLGFIRIHLGYLVNALYIFKVGLCDIVMENGDVLPMSKYRSAEVKETFQKIIRNTSWL